MKKAELLIPVGNKECLIAAINNGADAVYLGGKKYGARAYSNNFNEEEMIEAIKLCHLYNVKIYVTVNTMIFNEEIESVIDYLKFLYQNNVDAVIMQDNGLISLTRKLIPNLEIHVSTQAHNHNEEGISYYKEIGCTRVVFDRESSLSEINNIKTEIEKEVFVYGALCVCYSGNCLFSALNGSRSANRGMCVGSCRLPYKLYKDNKLIKENYLLSTKDLNTMPYLKEILDSNIDSLKIEGRMKSKEYVASVTKTYRKLIDAYYDNKPMILTDEDKNALLKTFNREFTKGYLFNETNIINEKTSNHQGVPIGKIIDVNNKKITILLSDDVHQNDAIRLSKSNEGMYLNTLYDKKGLLVSNVTKGNICQIDNKNRTSRNILLGSEVLKTIDTLLNNELNNIPPKKIKIDMLFNASLNKEISLTIKESNNEINLKGNIAEQSINRATTKEDITKQLSKLGNTPFELNNIDINIEDNLFINIKDLNEIRRQAIEQLIILKEGTKKKNIPIELPSIIDEIELKPKLSILVRNEDQLNIALRNNIDYIYIPDESLYNKYKEKDNVYLRLDRVLTKHNEYHNEKLLITEFGGINAYNKDNKIRTDYYLNVANDNTIKLLNSLNVSSQTLSVELSQEQLHYIKNKKNSEIIIYGTPECMIIKNNIFNIKDEITYIENTKNEKFPVYSDNKYTYIYNHEKINLIDKLNKIKGFGTYRIELLNESISETQNIINKIKNML